MQASLSCAAPGRIGERGGFNITCLRRWRDAVPLRIGVPSQPGIIAHRSKYRQDHNGTESHSAFTGLDLREAGKIRHGRHQYHYKNIKHRPLANEFYELIKTSALALDDGPAPLRMEHQHCQGD